MGKKGIDKEEEAARINGLNQTEGRAERCLKGYRITSEANIGSAKQPTPLRTETAQTVNRRESQRTNRRWNVESPRTEVGTGNAQKKIAGKREKALDKVRG
jgi:hypothetical protein